ncbi:MAG: hypothetical protein ABEJ31_02525 [Haloarculaceae archaeon]
MAATGPGDGGVTVSTEITDERTVVAVSGTVEAAVVIRSPGGERVYLPPETAGEDTGGGPYEGVSDDSPYDGATATGSEAGADGGPYEGVPDDSPYASARSRSDSLGVNPTADGFRVVHPEPATDVRLLR